MGILTVNDFLNSHLLSQWHNRSCQVYRDLQPNGTPKGSSTCSHFVVQLQMPFNLNKDRLYVALFARGGRATMPDLEDTCVLRF
jgi:hypothetical protein